MPTHVTTVGRFGAAIAARLAADPPSPAFAACRVRGPHDVPAEERAGVLPWYRATLEGELAPMLRAAATSGAGGRLDLLLVADVEEVGGPILVALAQTLSVVLAERFAVMFPPDTPAEQRGVGLVVVLATPAFDRSEASRRAIAALDGLVRWHRAGPPSPVLDRVFVLARQNEVMPLADADVERAVALFVGAAWRSGLRDGDVFRHRLGPPRDPERLIDAFSVAAADVDVPRLVAAFGWRSALAALARLAAQCEARAAVGHAPELDVDGWIAPVHGEPPATTLLGRAGAASPAELDALVRAVDGAEGDVVRRTKKAIADAVDARLGGDDGLVAFSAVRQGLERAAERARAMAGASFDSARRSAPRYAQDERSGGSWLPSSEAIAAAEAEEAAENAASGPLAVRLDEPHGSPARVASFPVRAEGLDRNVQESVRPERSPERERGAESKGGAATSPPVIGALLGVVGGAAAAAVTAVAGVRSATSAVSAGAGSGAGAGPGGHTTTTITSADSSTAVGGDATTALIVGIIVAIAIAAAWIAASKLIARRRRERDDETDRARVTPRSARQRRLVAALEGGLAVRRRRTARAAEQLLLDERARLDAMRGAIHAAAARCRAQLTELGVAPADEPAADDTSRLWAPETPLHLALLPAATLPRLWERSRAVREDELWAARLLARAWTRGGHRDDLPFADGAAWEQAAREQHAAIAQAGVFEWPEIGAALQGPLQRLLATAPAALGLGVRPRRADGTPEPLTDARELLIVTPPEGRAALERALAAQPIADARILAGPRGDSRVLILRTAGEMSLESIARGATS